MLNRLTFHLSFLKLLKGRLDAVTGVAVSTFSLKVPQKEKVVLSLNAACSHFFLKVFLNSFVSIWEYNIYTIKKISYKS
jgi:hypothetical protein